MHRIISLLPAGTEIVAALGAFDDLVAVTHECDFPAEVARLPRVTSSAVDRDASSSDIDADVRRLSASGLPVFALDAADVVRLAPTVILTQALCDVCAVSEGDVRDIAELASPAPQIIPLGGTTMDGVWADIGNVGKAIGRQDQAAVLLESISTRLLLVHQALKRAGAKRPRIAVIEWLDPLYSAGHWTPNIVRRAGGIDAIAEPGAHSVRVTVDQVRDAAPELLLFAPCGFDVERTEREASALLASAEWSWAKDIEAWAIDGNALTSRPGPRLADAVEVIAAIIAPTLFPVPPAHYARNLR
ncbi:MAG: ABC transporter substrate-binding protein [Gemmatimonadaceae bacterium]